MLHRGVILRIGCLNPFHTITCKWTHSKYNVGRQIFKHSRKRQQSGAVKIKHMSIGFVQQIVKLLNFFAASNVFGGMDCRKFAVHLIPALNKAELC